LDLERLFPFDANSCIQEFTSAWVPWICREVAEQIWNQSGKPPVLVNIQVLSARTQFGLTLLRVWPRMWKGSRPMYCSPWLPILTESIRICYEAIGVMQPRA